MKCVNCANLDLQKHATMAYHGFGLCTLKTATFPSMMRERVCQMFVQIEQTKAEKRIEWYENKRIRHAGKK